MKMTAGRGGLYFNMESDIFHREMRVETQKRKKKKYAMVVT
jgi:hypothetical protein